MKMWIVSIFLCIGVISNGATAADGVSPSTDEIVSKHMVADHCARCAASYAYISFH